MNLLALQARGPLRPLNPDPLAATILQAFASTPESSNLILGGQFALKHYLDLRMTSDIDGWWPQRIDLSAVDSTREALWHVVERVAAENGLTATIARAGRVDSFEIRSAGKTIFSVQTAFRDVEIDAPIESPWPPIKIETLRDNIASKMSALVDRGAPRDFTDVYNLNAHGVIDMSGCWDLFARKQPGVDLLAARLEALRKLEAIALRRPLDNITDPGDRETAIRIRSFFRSALTPATRDLDRPGPELER